MAEHPDPTGPPQPGAPSPGRTPAQPYTVHDDVDLGTTGGGATAGGDATRAAAVESPATESPAVEAPVPGRAGPDPVALLAGLAALLVAALALVDALGDVDPRWALAVVAIGVGGIVLLATLRRRRA